MPFQLVGVPYSDIAQLLAVAVRRVLAPTQQQIMLWYYAWVSVLWTEQLHCEHIATELYSEC